MKKILIVGYGSIGSRHTKNILKLTKFEVLIFSKRQDLNFNSKRVKVFNSLLAALKEKPEIGFITNETSNHIHIANILAKHGLDLFIEKPLSNSFSGIGLLNKSISTKNLITMVGCNLRFFPPLEKIKHLLEKKSIGRIMSVQIDSNSYLPDWHPYENYRLGYAARKDLGGGIVLTAIHELDYLHWFFGDVHEVFSFTGKYSDLDVDVDDMSSINLRFQNNVVAQIHLDYVQRPFFKSCKIIGTRGIIYWNSDENLVKIYNSKKQFWKIIFDGKNHVLSSPKLSNFMYEQELNYFLKCVKNRQQTKNSVEHAQKILKIALAIKRSSKYKKLISL